VLGPEVIRRGIRVAQPCEFIAPIQVRRRWLSGSFTIPDALLLWVRKLLRRSYGQQTEHPSQKKRCANHGTPGEE